MEQMVCAIGSGSQMPLASITFHPHDFAYLLYQVRFQRAADAAVLKRNEAFVFLAHDAALLDEVRVNVYLAYVIDDNCESDALFIGENMVY